ncbi:MAG: meromycolic acid enoyl-[acyl-carrier-protein] reductase [Frankiaceae bacterium]|nr:meromycolic acid enoyl-[acyl-carrier-protein] reductase [Frankiaceae bacterium]
MSSNGGILAGKRVLVTGVFTESSIAFATARIAQEQGAQVILTGFGRSLKITQLIAKRLPEPPPVLEFDVTDEEQVASLAGRIRETGIDGLDGVLHAVGFAPQSTFGDGFLTAPWEDVSTALHVSTYSLQSLTRATLDLLAPGSCILGLDFDASVAWPIYGWMGVAKAGLAATTRYLAQQLGERGIRVNLVSAGPLQTTAATHIPGFAELSGVWADRAPLGWDTLGTDVVGRSCVALLSDFFPATTGEIVHVDGGVHAVGAGRVAAPSRHADGV